MAAVIVFGNERADAAVGTTVEKAVRSLGRLPDTYIFILKGRPVPMTTTVSDGDVIEAIRIASGG
jgi:sulfur carrier protein